MLKLLCDSIQPANLTQLISRMTYGISMVCLFVSSILFHATQQSNKFWKSFFKQLDHICIFVLIAGSQTPLIIEGMGLESVEAWTILSLQWGFTLSGLLNNTLLSSQKRGVEPILYLIMGWMIIIIWPTVSDKMTGNGMYYMFAGGLSQTVGVIFFKIGDRIPIYHVILYVFVIFGSLFIFIAI